MTTPAESHDENERVTLDELVQLMAGELSATDEERLRTRMDRDPHAETMLEELRRVDEHFDRPGPVSGSEEIPADVVARLQAHLADLASRRVEGRLHENGLDDGHQS